MDDGERPTPDEQPQGGEPPRDPGSGEPPANEPAAPVPEVDATPPAPPQPPPLVAWSPEAAPPAATGPERTRTGGQRALEVVAWIVGIAAVLFFGRVFAVLSSTEDLTGEQVGRVFGSITAALLIAVGLRWLLVRAGRARRVISPWIPVIATFILLINLFSRIDQGGVPAGGSAAASPTASARPMTDYVEISPPYESEPADAETVEAFKAITDPGRQSTVRTLTEDGDVVGYLIIVDGGARTPTDGLAGYATSFEKASGNETSRVPLAGRDMVIGTAADQTVAVAWIEPPYLMLIYGADETSARDLATKVAESID